MLQHKNKHYSRNVRMASKVREVTLGQFGGISAWKRYQWPQTFLFIAHTTVYTKSLIGKLKT